MSLLLLENYIRESLILSENTIEPGEPTFGDVKGLLGLVNKKNRTKKWLGIGLKVAASFAKAKIELGNEVVKALKGKDVLNPNMVEDAIGLINSTLSDKLGAKVDLNSMSPEKLLARMYGINDEPGLKKLEVPDEVSELIDDDVETEFIPWMYEKVKEEDDSKIIPDTWVVEKLKEYTKNINTKTKGAFAEN